MKLGHKDIKRFWSKIVKLSDSECWEWQSAVFKDGYGMFGIVENPKTHRTVRAHRVAYEISRRCEIPNNMLVLHLCDNRICCNPSHLYCGSHSQNMTDMVHRNPVNPIQRGLISAKLYAGEIWLIRKLKIPIGPYRFKFSQGAVAKMFKVSDSTIWRIWKSTKWLCKEGYYV